MPEEPDRAFKEALKEGLRIQDRFVAEPVFARTGKGSMKRKDELAQSEKEAKAAKGKARSEPDC